MQPPDAHVAATGVSGLDDILRGGLPRKRIYLLQGDPGVGKTTLGLQFLLEGIKRGERGLYVTLSETEEELRSVAATHDWDLEGLALHQLSGPEEAFDPKKQNTLFHPFEVELNETISKVLSLVEQTKPARVVFDSLSEMRLLAGDSLKYRREILSLKQHFAGRNTTVLFLDDGTAKDGDTQLQSLAHGVISLEKMVPGYGAVRRRLEVVKLRGIDFRSGKHDYIIERSGLKVFPRLVAAEHHEAFSRQSISSGVPELDKLLGGGMECGTSGLLLGPAGSGKSSVVAQFVHAAIKRNERVAVFSFDENAHTFFARTSSMGMDFRGAQRGGQLLLKQVDPAELAPGEFVHAVRWAVEEQGARIVVIDSLNGYLMAMPDEKFLVIQMHELLSYLSQKGVMTLLVMAQHGLLGTMSTPIDVTYLSDTVILFRFFESEGKVRKAVSVLKKRVGEHEDSIREFQVSTNGVRLGAPLSEFRGVLSGTPQFSGRTETLLSEPKKKT